MPPEMDAIVASVRAQLTGLLKLVPESYRELLTSDRVPPKTKLEAIKDLQDRTGILAFKGSINQSIPGLLTVESLRQTQVTLVEERAKLSGEIEELRLLMPPEEVSDAVQGEESQDGSQEDQVEVE